MKAERQEPNQLGQEDNQLGYLYPSNLKSNQMQTSPPSQSNLCINVKCTRSLKVLGFNRFSVNLID